ncbi:hypothetical protein OS187_07240 [Xanthomonadaceae bacterium JHOS43]|nr:hypothetical protein [Xanthomonadaceae bacterium JHOS43]MCX7562887.1 hypothetical protein [Xanthomonadaceae bacterium XH05]
MPASRTLSIVGASEESVAHIRLLVRMAGARLKHQWSLRDGDEADLTIIEPQGDLASIAIQNRCLASGIPVAILCDQNDVVVHGMALRRPLKLDQLVAILNTAGEMRTESDIVTGLDADFYNTELGDVVPQGKGDATWDHPQHAAPTDTLPVPAQGNVPATGSDALDAFALLVHGDPLIEPEPKKPMVDHTTRVQEAQGGDSARRALRREDTATRDAAALIGVSPLDVQPISLGTPRPAASRETQAAASADAGTPVLPNLLREGAILSPVRVSAEGLPDVVLDPKLRRFYTQHPLHELLPYAEAGPETACSFAIAGSELQRVRESQIPRVFDELNWLFALAASHGRLNPKLDPGGSYSIKHPFVAAPELRAHGRIAALMTTPMPLHEVARASGSRMEEVFDIVNAYDAIGRIEYIPRQRLQQAAPQKSEKGGLFRLFTRK